MSWRAVNMARRYAQNSFSSSDIDVRPSSKGVPGRLAASRSVGRLGGPTRGSSVEQGEVLGAIDIVKFAEQVWRDTQAASALQRLREHALASPIDRGK